MKSLIIVLGSILVTGLASAQNVRYNVGFDTPDQVINEVVRTGPAPDHVSSISFGTPTVVPTFGPLTNQPMLFGSPDQAPLLFDSTTQVGFSLANWRSPNLELSFDFVDFSANHVLTLFFDTPNVRNFRFAGGNISFLRPFNGPTVQVGTYQFGTAYHFNIQLDNNLSHWRFIANGDLLAEGDFAAVDYVQSFRFGYSASTGDVPSVAIDNIVATIPEPTSFTLCGFALLVAIHKRRFIDGVTR